MAGESFQNNFFDTEYLKADLKGRSVRGGAVTMFAQGASFFLHMGSTIVLARLLTPQDFGLIAMVTAITGFVVMFKDMGLSMATVQKAEINHAQISTLFWINVALSLGVMLVTAALAPIIAWFYGEQRLTWITLALASAFIFGGFTIQHQALLRRNMRFGTLALTHIVSMLVGILVAITAAWYGAGYWALVIGQLARAIAGAIAIWVVCGWRPGLPVRRSGVRSMLAFGGHLTGFSVVNYFARNLDNVLLGRFCGASVLGLYSKAYNIMMLPINQVRGPLNAVAMPALSNIQNDPIRFKSFYIRLITLISFITMPLMVFLFVCADQVIRLLLGDQWSGAVNIFKILCVVAFIQPVAGTVGLVLISLGQSKRYFTIGTIHSIIIVISFILGLPWGAIGVAVAYTIATYVMLAPTLWYSFRQSPVSIMDFFSAISRPATASVIMGFIVLLFRSCLNSMSDIVLIGCSFIISFLTYLILLLVVPGGLPILQEFSSYRFLLFQKST